MQARIRALVAEVLAVSARFSAHRGSLAAGGLAFFVSLSIAPAAVIIGWIASYILTPADVRTAVDTLLSQTQAGNEALAPITNAVVGLIENPSTTTVTTTSIISFFIAVYASSRVVYGMRLALNTAFGVSERYRGIVERVASAVVTLIGLVAVVAGLVLVVVIPQVLAWLGIHLTAFDLLSGRSAIVDAVLGLIVVWFFTWLLMHRTPNLDARLPVTALGPVLAAVWIVGVTGGVGIYVSMSRTIGAAAAIFGAGVVFLLWLYLCFAGLLFAAEFEGLRRERKMTL